MFKQYNTGFQKSTPNFEVSEGIRPAQHYVVPSYLPLLGYDKKNEIYKVLGHGKVVSVDSLNYLVPAGLALDIDTAIAEGVFTNCVNKYSQTDVDEAVRNFAGTLVTLDEPVVKSFFTAGDATQALLNAVGFPIGVAAFDAYRQNGAGYGAGYGAGDPTDYTYNNYNLQQGVTVLTRYFVEVPVVANLSALRVKGLTVFTGAPKPGDLVTFDANSNFVSVAKLTIAAITASSVDAYTTMAATDAELKAEFDRVSGAVDAKIDLIEAYVNGHFGRILGKIMFVDDKWPKDYLEYVRTWQPTTNSTDPTDVAPGAGTNGLPDQFGFAGVTVAANAKLAKINIII